MSRVTRDTHDCGFCQGREDPKRLARCFSRTAGRKRTEGATEKKTATQSAGYSRWGYRRAVQRIESVSFDRCPRRPVTYLMMLAVTRQSNWQMVVRVNFLAERGSQVFWICKCCEYVNRSVSRKVDIPLRRVESPRCGAGKGDPPPA